MGSSKNRIKENIISLYGLQFANYILPLISMPYLLRVLGPEIYGEVIYALTAVGYFILLVDYGFNLTGTSAVARARNDFEKLREIFSGVVYIKLGFILISTGLIVLIYNIYGTLNLHPGIFLMSFCIIITNVLFPIWFLQGLEEMKFLTLCNIMSRIFFTIAIFWVIKNDSDAIYVPLLNFFGALISGVVSIIYLRKKLGHLLIKIGLKEIKKYLKDGFGVFFSTISISLYTLSITLILGIVETKESVGFYGATDRLVQAMKGLSIPVASALFPVISQKLNQNQQSGIAYAIQNGKKLWLLMGIMGLMSLFGAELAVNLIFGAGFQQSIILLKIMSFVPLLVSISNVLGIQIMLNIDMKKEFTISVSIISILGLCLSYILIDHYGTIGAATSVVIIETMVTLTLFIVLKNKLCLR